MTTMTNNDTLLISMHMEKCGGTSLDRLLRDEYKEGFHLYDRGEPKRDSEPELPAGISCLHGHMFYGLHEKFPQRHCEYITLLRDPVDRFLSNFEHVCNYEHPLHKLAIAENGLHEFCVDSQARHYRNLFVRRLSGVWDEIEEADLNRAEENLRTFSVIGWLDQVDDFISSCHQRFGWQQHQLSYQNKSLGRRRKIEDLDPELQQQVLAANDWDRQLMLRISDLLPKA